MSIAEKLVTVAQNQQKVFEAGKKSEYDRFWDEFQKDLTLSYMFAGKGWTDETYNPRKEIKTTNGYGANYVFAYSNITDTKVNIDFSNLDVYVSNLFYDARNLKTIKKLIVGAKTPYTNCFINCTALENVTFEGIIGRSINFSYSPLLSKESIENIVECLSESETSQTLTLSQTAVDNAFTTAEWNTLIAGKTNWTFSLI